MEDLIERLRAPRETPTHEPDIAQVSPPSPLALEAADEIERLRKIADEAQLVVDEIRRSGTHVGWKLLAGALEPSP